MSWRARALTAWTGVVFILATLLLSNPGDERAAPRASASPTTLDLLLMPIARSQPAELRLLVLPVGLAGLLLISALFPTNASATNAPPSRPKKGRAAPTSFQAGTTTSFVVAYWLELLSAATIALALASTFANASWLISRGWLLQLAAGCGWAILISRLADRRCLQRILLAGSLIAVVAIALSFWHRQTHHVEYFAWPIGPVTMSAGMAAIWAGMAFSFAIACAPRAARVGVSWPSVVWMGLVAVCAVAMLVIAARRGAWLAALAATGYSILLVAWRAWTTRRARALCFLAASLHTALAAAYVVIQIRSANPRASIPITYRLIYWKNTLALLSDAWLLGHGPDSFLCKMSAIIAGERARMPHVLHGTIDPEAHNEWLQAIFELGLPGGLAYLAIPLIVVFLATRSWLRADGTGSVMRAAKAPIIPLALAAGLLTILISEAGSICLRRGGMNVWYWTLIGVAAAWTRAGVGHPLRGIMFSPFAAKVGRLAAVTVALALVVVVSNEVRRRIAHVRGNLQRGQDDLVAARTLSESGWRLGAWQALAARADLADAQLAAARSSQFDASQAAATWSELHRRCPAYPGAAFRLAQAQQLAGDAPAACETLKHYLSTINAHDMPANTLYVTSCHLPPREILEHVRRALRDGEWTTTVEPMLAAAFGTPDIAAAWPGEVLADLHSVSADFSITWADTSTPETLRLEAARFAAVGDFASAARIQAVAVRAYERLEKENSPYRRVAFAEADASLRHANYLFLAEPLRTAQALERLREAERLAIGGLPQRAVAGADPQAEWVGGRVVPAEFPPRLRALWRFSAMLHLAAGSDPRLVQVRAEWSLPADQRSPQQCLAQICSIAAELVEIFSPFESARRPASYSNLVVLANYPRPAPAALPNP